MRAHSPRPVASLLTIALALGSIPAIVRAQTAAPIPPIPSVEVSVSASVGIGTASAPPPPPSAPPPVAPTTPPAKAVECVVPPKRGPAVLAYEDDLPVPPGYRVVHHERTLWSRGGWAVFGVSYGIAVMGASLAGNDNHDPDAKKWNYLFVPVAGPLFLMGPQSEGLGNFWLATWALVQGAGLGAAIYGMSSDEVVLYREDIARAKPKNGSKPRAIAVTPVVTSTTLALGMSGAF